MSVLSLAVGREKTRGFHWKRGAAFGGWGLLGLVLLMRAQPKETPVTPPMPLAYEYIASPNFNERPANTPITAVVLHSTVEPTTEGTINIFLNPASQVSAHFVVGRDGRVVQMVPLEKRAWHAGVSTLDGQGDLNNYSVGIEMVNLNDGKDPYPDAQVQAVAGIIRFLRAHYTITDDHIVSHAQIALPAGRKTDPAGFDFTRIRQLASYNALNAPAGPASVPLPAAPVPAPPATTAPAPTPR